jgi:hypothetical protein
MDLQNAAMLRAADKKTPAADHVLDRLQFEQQDKLRTQAMAKTQADAMLQRGDIDQARYNQILLGIQAGDQNVITSVISSLNRPNTSTDITNRQQSNQRFQMQRDKRRAITTQMTALTKDPIAALADPSGHAAKIADLQKQLGDLDAEDDKMFGGASGGVTSPIAVPTAAPQVDPLDGQTIRNPTTGERRVRRAGQWMPL